MRKTDAQRYVGLFDAHVGLEKQNNHGKVVDVPTHSFEAINTALEFVEWFEPDIVVLGGDQCDLVEMAHHNNGKPRLKEGFRLQDTLDMVDGILVKPIEKLTSRRTKKVWLQGNHERFVQDFLDKYPELEGCVSIEKSLDLAKRGWEIVDLGGIYQIGKNNIVHGDKLKTKYPAQEALTRYRRSVRFGHRHTSSHAVDPQPFDRPEDRHTAKGIPCLRSLNPAWMHNETHAWLHGLLAGFVQKNGNFTDWVLEMYGEQFVFDGHLFDGRSVGNGLKHY